MPSSKTKATEIAVACGLKSINSESLGQAICIENVSSEDTAEISQWINASAHQKRLFDRLNYVGEQIAKHWGQTPSKVSWFGNEKTNSASVCPQDVVAHFGPATYNLSVKASGGIIWNGSPSRIYELFAGLDAPGQRGENWYDLVASQELNDFYLACATQNLKAQYPSAMEYLKSGLPKETKKEFSEQVALLMKSQKTEVVHSYKALSRKVSEASAELFNTRLCVLSEKSPSSLKSLFWQLFRVDSCPYILCGTDNAAKRKDKCFAREVMSVTQWEKSFYLEKVCARSSTSSQPEVFLDFQIKEKENKNAVHNLTLRVEIRWTHGKFCGNPEAKVQKTFSYDSLPWTKSLI